MREDRRAHLAHRETSFGRFDPFARAAANDCNLPAADGKYRRLADIADRVRGRDSWAESAPIRVVSGTAGIRAIAVIPSRRSRHRKIMR